MKKAKVAILLSLPIFATAIFGANASATDYNASTAAELKTAIDEIAAGTSGTHTITLGADININDLSVFPGNIAIANGNNVTLLGNYTLKIVPDEARIVVNNATLNLGSTSASGPIVSGAGNSMTSLNHSMITLGDSAVLNMYAGSKIIDNISNAMIGGTAVRVGNNAIFNMHGGEISNNHGDASMGGCAVILDDSNAVFNMYGGEIKNNTSGGVGGGVYMDSKTSTINIAGGTFSGNSTDYGGAIYVANGTLTVTGGTFTQNTSYYGGAILAMADPAAGDYVAVSIANATFTNNTAYYYGGAVMVQGADNTISGNTFKGNNANTGAGFVNGGGKTTSANNSFTENTASNMAGAIYTEGDFVSTGDTITNNSSSDMIGGVAIGAGASDFTGSKIYNNNAANQVNDLFVNATGVTEAKLPDPSTWGVQATFGSETVDVDGWYSDGDSNRYSPSNITTNYEVYTPGTALGVTAAFGDKKTVSYDTDGAGTLATKKLLPGSTIKLDADGGSVSSDEITVNDDLTVETPTRDGYTFKGWSVVEDANYDLALKAAWEKAPDPTPPTPGPEPGPTPPAPTPDPDPEPAPTPTPTPEPENPVTNDEIASYVLTFALSILGLGAACVIKR